MNSTLKSLLFWMVLVVILALIWQFSVNLQTSSQVITFSDFLERVNTGQVSEVKLSGFAREPTLVEAVPKNVKFRWRWNQVQKTGRAIRLARRAGRRRWGRAGRPGRPGRPGWWRKLASVA